MCSCEYLKVLRGKKFFLGPQRIWRFPKKGKTPKFEESWGVQSHLNCIFEVNYYTITIFRWTAPPMLSNRGVISCSGSVSKGNMKFSTFGHKNLFYECSPERFRYRPGRATISYWRFAGSSGCLSCRSRPTGGSAVGRSCSSRAGSARSGSSSAADRHIPRYSPSSEYTR